MCRDSSCMTQTVILGMGAQFHRYVSYRDHDILFLFLSFFPLCLFFIPWIHHYSILILTFKHRFTLWQQLLAHFLEKS